jgi:hypothetical protein
MASQDYLNSRKTIARQRPQGLIFTENYTYDSTNLYLPAGSEINSDGQDQSFLILSDDNRSAIDISKSRIEKRERMINGRMRSYHIADKTEISTSWSLLPSRSFSSDPNFSSGVLYNITGVQMTDANTKIQFAVQQNHDFTVGSTIELLDFPNNSISGFHKVTDISLNTFKIAGTSVPLIVGGSPKARTKLGAIKGIVTEISQNPLPAMQIESYGSQFFKDQQFTTDGGAGGNDLLTWYENHPGSFYVLLGYDKYDDLTENKYSKLSRYNQAVEVYFSNFSYSVEKRGQSSHDFWTISLSLEEV